MRSIKLIAFIFMLQPLDALSWRDLGHQVIGDIAWAQLNDATKAKVTELLKLLTPHYEEAHSMAGAATIADHMHPWLEAFNAWHFVNLPFGPLLVTMLEPSSTNIVTALCECVRTLNPQSGARPFEKAFMLQFFLHLVGDIHQPLHCVSRFTPLLPSGDMGGNLHPIVVDNETTSLHVYWDSGLGVFGQKIESDVLAKSIMKEYPPSKFGDAISATVFREWAIESHELAKNNAYTLKEGYAPEAAYIKKGQALVKERVALAGYRLGSLLNTLLNKGYAAVTGCP